MKIRHFLFSIGLLTGLMIQASCFYDNVQELHPELLLNNDCDTSAVMSYQTHIKPILNNSCGANTSCHNSQSAGGGVILDTYAGLKSNVANGKLMSSILWDGNTSYMPKSSPAQIKDCSIAKIQKWIAAGALDN